MTHPFLDIEPTEHPTAFRLRITDRVCVGPPGNVFMFGGVGLAAATIAAERATGRRAVWSSAQFISYARIGDTLDLAVETLSAGRNISQVRVLATDAGKPILSVHAALGDREGQPDGQWVAPLTDMPPPEQCEPWPLWPVQDARLMDRLDVRMAPGRYGAVPREGQPSADGRMVLWMRPKEEVPIDAAMLAIFADFVPSGLAAAFGRRGGGQQPRQYAAHREAGPDRLGAVRRAHQRCGARLRPWRDPHVCGGRHDAGKRQPVRDPALHGLTKLVNALFGLNIRNEACD